MRIRTTYLLGAAAIVMTGSLRAEAQTEPAPSGQPPTAPTPAAPTQETAPPPPPVGAAPAETPSTSPAPAAPPAAPIPQPAVAAPAPPPKPAPEAPKKLWVGTAGLFQPGLLLQGWFLLNHYDTTSSTFRLRRAEIHLLGEIIKDRVGYEVMIDPAKVLEFDDKVLPVANQEPGPSDPAHPESVTAQQPASAVSVMQDLFITFKSRLADVSIGQFKIPVSWEGYNSSAKLLFPERALVAREYGDKRDLGVRIAKSGKHFGYSAGVFNGAGLNRADNNNDKDLALRLEAYPIQGMTLAGVIYSSVGNRKDYAKDRYEADARLERGPFLFQAEYIRARDLGKQGPAIHAQGFYAALAWTFFGVLQPAVRLGYFDPNIRTNVDPSKAGGRDEVWHVEGTLNYYIRKHETKLQLSYSRFQFDNRPAGNEAILAAQVSF